MTAGRPAPGPEAVAGLADLERRLLEAHLAGDRPVLSGLYAEASERAEAAGQRQRAAFYLTHAWVFALEAGLASAETFGARLRSWGRS